MDYCETLTYLANLSFEEGTFPSSTKLSKVVRIVKNKNRVLVENYVSVTVPTDFIKLFKHGFWNRLRSFHRKSHGFGK